MTEARPFQRTSRSDTSARKPYDIISEPIGDGYRGLLSSALTSCETGLLVLRGEPSAAASQLLELLEPHLEGQIAVPMGTMLRFRFNAAVVEILADAVTGLYRWRAPDLPEDLCLFRGDGTPWLVTVSQERFGYVEMTPFEKLLVGRAAPEMVAALVHQGARDAILAVFERHLERHLEELSVQLADYSRALLDENRDGVVDALGEWLASAEPSRVSVALDVIAAVELDELGDEAHSLQNAVRAGLLASPSVFRNNSVLSARWSELHRQRLDRVVTALGKDPA